MANIPVERKRGGAWWLWLLALLILALIVWLLWSWFAAEEEPVVPPVAMEEPVEPAGAVDLVDQATLLAAPDPAVYVGQRVTLTGLQVQQVLGDVTFTVSTPDDPVRALVVLDQTPSPEVPGVEGQVDINPGQTVNVTGTLQPMPADPAAQWNVSADRAEELAGQTVYVHADEVGITQSELDEQVEVE